MHLMVSADSGEREHLENLYGITALMNLTFLSKKIYDRDNELQTGVVAVFNSAARDECVT